MLSFIFFEKKMNKNRRRKLPKMHLRKIKKKLMNEWVLINIWKDKLEVTVKCIDSALSNWGFMLIHQKLGASFCAPKIGYWSQKQPVLPPTLWAQNSDVILQTITLQKKPSEYHFSHKTFIQGLSSGKWYSKI